ncbi:MAG TPA: hypothetical protein VJ955_03535 [Desulfuromonadales bacterium]|nr:hypothetical protein [Desulfuromonadales bacterium]
MANAEKTQPVRLRTSPEVARIVAAAPDDLKLAAARGQLSLSGRDLVTVLLIFTHGQSPELKTEAQRTLRHLSAAVLIAAVEEGGFPAGFFDVLVRLRPDDVALMRVLLEKKALREATLVYVAAHGRGSQLNVMAELSLQSERPALREALGRNPHADHQLLVRLGIKEDVPPPQPPAPQPTPVETEDTTEDLQGEEVEEEPEEELNASKFQQSMDMVVAEKIKQALTGDKEWRSIFLRDANKLVSSAVLKNPRITEGEVLSLVKNRSSSDELIRLITLNREWVKNYEIRRALVQHPRTPLPKALRYMSSLGDRDIKNLAKSRNVSPMIVNNARRIQMSKEKGK